MCILHKSWFLYPSRLVKWKFLLQLGGELEWCLRNDLRGRTLSIAIQIRPKISIWFSRGTAYTQSSSLYLDDLNKMFSFRWFSLVRKYLSIHTCTATVTFASASWLMTGLLLFLFTRFALASSQCSAVARKRYSTLTNFAAHHFENEANNQFSCFWCRNDPLITTCTWKRAARIRKRPNGGTMVSK